MTFTFNITGKCCYAIKHTFQSGLHTLNTTASLLGHEHLEEQFVWTLSF